MGNKGKGKGKKAYWLIAGAITFLFVILYGSGGLRRLEYSFIDLLFNLRLIFWGVQEVDKRLVVAAIDDYSIRELGKVPWPRSVYANLLREVMRYDPALVVFDVLFTEPDTRHPEEDKALVAATKRWSDKIIHAMYESIEASNQGSFSLPRITVNKPYAALMEVTKHIGFVDNKKLEGTAIVDSLDLDGSLRRAHLYKQTAEGESVLSLGAAAYALLEGISVEEYMRSRPAEIQINFPGIERQYTQGGKIIEQEPFVTIPIADIVYGRLSDEMAQRLKGAVIMVASMAVGYYDHYPTPYSAMTPGVAVHLYSLNNLLLHNYLKSVSRWAIIALIIVLGFSLSLMLARFSALANFFFLAAVFTGLWTVALLLFAYGHTIFDALTPSISTFVIFAAVTLYRTAVEEREKRWIRNTFSQYLSPKVVSLLVENPDAIKLGGEKRMMSVLFLDIAHFTTISEKLPPEELTQVLNHYLTIFSEIILKYDGVVDKFVGDAIMAFWNAPFDQPQHAAQALMAALEMSKQVKTKKFSRGPDIDIRIGVHTGYMVVGNMGSQARLSYTAIGDNVNFASRLEGANKYFKTTILTSEVTYELCKDKIIARELGRIRVVGKEVPVGIYEVLGVKNGSTEFMESLKIWKSALYALRSGVLEEAKRQFETYLIARPDDPAALTYLKMIDKNQTDFVINLTEK